MGQDISGAGRRRAELRGAGRQSSLGQYPWGRTSWGRTSWSRTSLRGAGRRWGKISGAGGRGAEGSGAGSVSQKISINIPNIFVFVGTNK